ncbi:DMT family transporter [Rheinheimera sp.]|uniref:DMT family transporter n=1 Tax=Rheinheimera sp. TaxID=1869214 RepID=UPI0027BA0EDC|nr:DMT family transporter [Rheinheimera sp.]
MNSAAVTSDEWPGLWRMLVAMLLSGTIGWFVVESGQNTATVVFYRCLIGGFALLLYLSWQGGWQKLNKTQSGYLVLGGLALVANWFCLFGAYHLSSISIATLVYHTQPFFLLLITALLQRQAPSAARWGWLAVAFCGVALTTGLQFGDNHQQLWLGVGLAALAACLYAVATLTTRQLTGVQPAQIAGLQMMLGVVLMLPLDKTSLTELALPSLAALCTLGLVHTGLMYNLMYSAFQRLPVSSIAFLSFVYPLVAVLIDLWFYQVTLSLLQVSGMLLILLAIVANQRQWAFWPFAVLRR